LPDSGIELSACVQNNGGRGAIDGDSGGPSGPAGPTLGPQRAGEPGLTGLGIRLTLQIFDGLFVHQCVRHGGSPSLAAPAPEAAPKVSDVVGPADRPFLVRVGFW